MISQVDVDAARINAVHAKLAGPQKVWVLVWDCVDIVDQGFDIYTSKEKALDALIGMMEDDSDGWNAEERADAREAIKHARKGGSCEFGGYEYTITERIVH